jgi:molybdenum cofactor biosynthesis enzyme MoaA
MYLDEILNYYKGLDIKELSVEEFKQYGLKCFDSIKNEQQLSSFEDLKIFPLNHIVEEVLNFWSVTTNNPNPLMVEENKKLKQHDFFKNRNYVCAAPYTSLKFDMHGRMVVCCNNQKYPIGIYPENTPLEAWNGEKIKEIREALLKFDFSKGCQQCAKSILAGNVENSIIAAHDKRLPEIKKFISLNWPVDIAFQHQNTCNYECIMCGGDYSSLIARNREKKPLQTNPYNNDKFLKDIESFIPHALSFEFFGGEPFLITQHYKIWELIKTLNPNASVDIISNGSIYNSKIEDLLLKLPNSRVNISIDAISPEIYSYIRRNGNIENVKNNIIKFKKIDRLGSLSVCPMIQNIRDIPNVIKFCETVDTDIWFNEVESALGLMHEDIHENGNVKRETILNENEKPAELIKEFRLWKLPKNELRDHILFLKDFKCPERYVSRYSGLINYIENYLSSL